MAVDIDQWAMGRALYEARTADRKVDKLVHGEFFATFSYTFGWLAIRILDSLRDRVEVAKRIDAEQLPNIAYTVVRDPNIFPALDEASDYRGIPVRFVDVNFARYEESFPIISLSFLDGEETATLVAG